MACEKCAPFGGLWMETPSGMKRCECLPAKPGPRPPVLTSVQAAVFVEMLVAIPYFPAESGTRTAIGDELASICSGPETALWLVRKMRRLYTRWPGPNEMRRVYASEHHPLDAIQPLGISEFYPDGIPRDQKEPEQRAIAGPAVKLLANRQKHEIIEDPEREAMIREAAAKVPKMPSGKPVGGRFEQHLRELETPPHLRAEDPPPTPQIITQADVDKAVEELHKQGKENS